jgi:hypothetical protein
MIRDQDRSEIRLTREAEYRLPYTFIEALNEGSLLVKVMMLYAIKKSGRDAPDEQYLAHVVDSNGGPIHALLEAGSRSDATE